MDSQPSYPAPRIPASPAAGRPALRLSATPASRAHSALAPTALAPAVRTALVLAALWAAALPLPGQEPAPGGDRTAPPPLTVVVVVDQMRPDLLERFGDQFTGGFGRLLAEGAVYTRASHRHGVPHTGPGHASLATGTHPSRHGIVANNWLDRETGQAVYAVDDPAHTIPGDPEAAGRSPASLARPALGEAVRRAHPGARVVAVAGKDRSAVLMAGADSDGAYWFDRASGRFETSSYWAEGQPSWLEALNDSGLADSLAAEPWALSRPLPVYERSRGEALWPDEAEVGGFPYPPAAEGSTPDRFAPSFATRPYLDELTFAVARAAVEHHGLGEDEIPDLLWVGASAADFIGHGYGPFSREVQDHFLRLDAMLGDFLAWLDERLGGAYVVALSSDHGVLPMPEELARRGYDAGRIPADSLATSLRRALDAATTAAGVDAQVAAGLIVLDAYMMFPEDVAEPTRRDIRSRTAATLRRLPGIADVVTLDEVQDSTTARPLVALYRNSWFPGRSPDLWIRPRDGWLAGLGDRITAHIAPYDYDLRVPLILAGPGIVPGRYGRAVATVDLAPTLAALLAVEAGDVDGSPLHEALAGGIDNR